MFVAVPEIVSGTVGLSLGVGVTFRKDVELVEETVRSVTPLGGYGLLYLRLWAC